MDIKTAQERHKKLWGWLAKTGSHKKDDYPEWGWNGGTWETVINDCFACELAKWEMIDNRFHCTSCPIEWPEGFCELDNEMGLFDQWCDAISFIEDRKSLAAQIRDLPWKVDNET